VGDPYLLRMPDFGSAMHLSPGSSPGPLRRSGAPVSHPTAAVPVSHRGTATVARHRPTSARQARDRRHIGTLMPRLINHTFAGQDVAKPIIIPICMRNQKAAVLVIS
jgi:hypothetical protein